jgi:hypothetical protein
MLRRIVGTNIIKRFNHTHSKPTFTENNKTIEYLLREQNKKLEVISTRINTMLIFLVGIQITIILHP